MTKPLIERLGESAAHLDAHMGRDVVVSRDDAALEREAADEIVNLRAALKVAQQALLEFSHAQEVGPGWYTRGANGMYRQVQMWLQRGLAAVQGALGPYDDNGEYLKEKSTSKPDSVLPIGSPTDPNKIHTYSIDSRPRIVPSESDRITDVWVADGKLCLIIKPVDHTGYSG